MRMSLACSSGSCTGCFVQVFVPPGTPPMALRALITAIVLAGLVHPVTAQNATSAARPATLFMAGDSTMATVPVVPAAPGRGWGQMLQPYFQDSLRVENL